MSLNADEICKALTVSGIIAAGASPTRREELTLEVLLPVVVKQGPELAQGVFRNVTVDPYNADPMSYIVPLGYLTSIWQKVCFPSYPTDIINIEGATGEDLRDFAQSKPNFLCSGAQIDLLEIPAGVDMRFGKSNNVYAGQVAFFNSSRSKHPQDWGLITPLRTTKTFEIRIGVGSVPPGVPVPPPQEYAFLAGGFSGVVKVPYTGLLGRGEVNPTPPSSASATFVFATKSRNPKAKTQLQAGIENEGYHFFPLQYINWESSMFFPQNPIANGFWWHLKEGVTANIRLFGTLTDPGVEATGGESGNAKFNPMKGEELP